MGLILDILGSAGFGGILGGVFAWLGKKEERANLQMKLTHDLSMVKAKTDATLAVAKAGIEEAKVTGELLVEKIEAKAFDSAQKTTSRFAEVLKSLVRPVVLSCLMYQTYLIMSSLEGITGGLEALPAEDIIGLYKVVVLSVTGLTATAVGFYFASRTSKSFDKLVERF